MLSKERQDAAFEASARILTRYPFIEDTFDVRAILTAEHLKTQRALDRLGISNKEYSLVDIPGINQVLPTKFFAEEEQDLPIIVSVIGVPKAGKTTASLEYLGQHRCYFVGEKYLEAKAYTQRGQQTIEENYLFIQDLKSLFGQSKAMEYVSLIREGNRENFPILQGRGWLDRPVWARTHTLLGNTIYADSSASGKVLYDTFNFIEANIDFPRKFRRYHFATILCLIPPNISLARGATRDKNLLSTLYEQYLRLHYELTSFTNETGMLLPFTYACLDFTGTEGENSALFEQTMDQVL